MDKVVIRYGEVKDLPEIVQLIQDLNSHQNYVIDSPNEKKLMEDGFGTGGDSGYTLVAEVTHANGKTELVGTISYALTYFISVGKMANFSGFFVKASHRSLGIGSKLYKKAIKDVFEKHGGVAVAFNTAQDNEASQNFYKDLGATDGVKDLKLYPFWHFKGKPFEKF